MNMNEKFKLMARPPEEALNTIQFGKLKGKSDINPQWRIEALTEVFGLCGVGWYYEILSVDHQDLPETKERMVYITVGIHVKQDDGTWSAPVIGIGGDFTIVSDRNGIHGNDEAYQMALTDALGKAAKCLGIANDIYRGKYDSKYGWRDERAKKLEAQRQTEWEKTAELSQALLRNQQRLDAVEKWRMVSPDDIQIKARDGNFYPIQKLSKDQLKKAMDNADYVDIKKYIEAEYSKR